MRDYSLFDQLSDGEFEGVTAAVRNYINSDQRGYFGFVPAEAIVDMSTMIVSGICGTLAMNGMGACQGHNYKENKEDK